MWDLKGKLNLELVPAVAVAAPVFEEPDAKSVDAEQLAVLQVEAMRCENVPDAACLRDHSIAAPQYPTERPRYEADQRAFVVPDVTPEPPEPNCGLH